MRKPQKTTKKPGFSRDADKTAKKLWFWMGFLWPPSRIMTSVGPLHLLTPSALVGHGRGPPSVPDISSRGASVKNLSKAGVFSFARRARPTVRPALLVCVQTTPRTCVNTRATPHPARARRTPTSLPNPVRAWFLKGRPPKGRPELKNSTYKS